MIKGFMIVPVVVDDAGEMQEVEGARSAIYPLDHINGHVDADVRHGENCWVLRISTEKIV